MPLESKALVDLVILKNASGEQALIPRSLITKYPVLLASSREGRDLAGIHSVIPWSSRPKVKEEQLPVKNLFIKDVTHVELANFQHRFRSYYLKRRTDPSALRGENLFLRNCVSCHSSKDREVFLSEMASEVKSRSLASGHPSVPGFTPLSPRDQRAIQSYFRTLRAENGQPGSTNDRVAQH